MRTDSFNEGYAHAAQKHRYTNPYPANTDEHEEFARGYFQYIKLYGDAGIPKHDHSMRRLGGRHQSIEDYKAGATSSPSNHYAKRRG
ncbi:hypothetical protein [Salinivibrio sp. ES.052]|uniref:hypothetical protein n=1 Tax=Salinivibrio sp. ES.052 TaxID=1882823 RepID=UPI000925D120|nr:hypothetical protein [Salinivibrio sp. ES.052]SIO27653.1 hypothetical protein SAMN05444724_2575 [Salinivibrio sp. ES.052]